MSIHAGGASTCTINGLGQRLCTGSSQFGQLAKATPATSTINTSPVPTVIPAALIPSSFSVPSAFVTVSNAASVPVCTLLLSVKVDATCDPTPPVFDPALDDISVDATSAAGAVVTYAPTATDTGAPVAVTCNPASGSQFAFGTTPVTCTAGVTTGTFNVIVAAAAPAFAANAPTSPFEATVNTPYLGTSVAGLYTPSASDPVDGDLSASIETFLVSNDQQISLSGVDAYIFPLGSTQIKNTVTNSFGVSSEELVTIVVVDTTKPVVTCTATDAAPVAITYSPPSGSSFVVGQITTVTCTATDSSGNTATGTFTVNVRKPPGSAK
ncbi:hypothetical protein Rsub_13350 [Raphidocelis subcapitata]|uniref:HYR domain-containing protein n=1 Tax=Raphidocelis subcapitata TaxID=307507 RepID=A0A2V0PLX1_9CHLO|nr:hypothetical protein Rsub_13350 [Raphidocelis subcapitata]|eukprot:GBG00560.1 hypothetical protein Rsub_13350 [Raphidocelis subcapitata]